MYLKIKCIQNFHCSATTSSISTYHNKFLCNNKSKYIFGFSTDQIQHIKKCNNKRLQHVHDCCVENVPKFHISPFSHNKCLQHVHNYCVENVPKFHLHRSATTSNFNTYTIVVWQIYVHNYISYPILIIHKEKRSCV